MNLPNKLFATHESCIGKFPIILKELKINKKSVLELYKKKQKQFDSVTDYMDTLDALFFLRKIDIEEGKGDLYYID